MTIAASVQDCLVREGVHYDLIAHERTQDSNHSAQAAHISGDRLAKCVMLEETKGVTSWQWYRPATRWISLPCVVSSIAGSGLRPIASYSSSSKTASRALCRLWALAYGVDTILDQSLVDAPDIYFEADDHRALVHVSGSGFLKLMANAPRGQISYHA